MIKVTLKEADAMAENLNKTTERRSILVENLKSVDYRKILLEDGEDS